jgi:hypothetical protein
MNIMNDYIFEIQVAQRHNELVAQARRDQLAYEARRDRPSLLRSVLTAISRGAYRPDDGAAPVQHHRLA